MLMLMLSISMNTYAAAMKINVAPIVPARRAFSGLLLDIIFTMIIPITEQIRPTEAKPSGNAIRAFCEPSVKVVIVDAMVKLAIIEPQYDSKISEPIPATSPTLSPTLSAITPGLRGSSSGIPASTLPTRSAPTSALLVKIPPPTRENRATVEAPIPKP